VERRGAWWQHQRLRLDAPGRPLPARIQSSVARPAQKRRNVPRLGGTPGLPVSRAPTAANRVSFAVRDEPRLVEPSPAGSLRVSAQELDPVGGKNAAREGRRRDHCPRGRPGRNQGSYGRWEFRGPRGDARLACARGELVTVELMAPDPEFLYRPLAVARLFGLSEVHRFPLGPLAERCGARYRPAALTAVDAPARLCSDLGGRVGLVRRARRRVRGANAGGDSGRSDLPRPAGRRPVSKNSSSRSSRERSSGSPSPSLRASPGRYRSMSSRFSLPATPAPPRLRRRSHW
jgi:hypothetical protein